MNVYGQPDQEYINRLEGLNQFSAIKSITARLAPETLNWKRRMAPGFSAAVHKQQRHQADLQEWFFIPVDSTGKLLSAEMVKIPHHFKAKRNYHSAWYVKKINLEDIRKERFIVLFDQVKMFCQLYVNDKLIDHHFGGLTPFEIDITPALRSGENTLYFFVYDELATIDNGKAYNQLGVQRPWDLKPAGGINRVPVLEKRPSVYLKDVFVKTSTRKKEISLEIEIENTSIADNKFQVKFELFEWATGKPVPIAWTNFEESAEPGQTGKYELKFPWENPKLWSPEHPFLYVLRTQLSSKFHTDILDTRFGFREFWIDGKSFVLNGKPIRLRGESSYDQHAVNGAEFHRELFKLQKKQFGVNANRLHAHLVTGDAPLGADEAGVLLIDQSGIWSVMHSFYRKGGDWFLANIKQEFEEWVRRDRNSPSVVIWDVENEMLRISRELNLEWVKRLDDFILSWDATRPICNSGAGWFDENQDMVHLHMQEHYTKIMDDWGRRSDKPLIIGEFWVGGRGGPRLPTAKEFRDMDDRYVEEAKSYQDQILNMRKMGVSGIMPFRISNLSFYAPPGSDKKYVLNDDHELVTTIRSPEVTGKVKHALQAVTAFVWPRQNYLAADSPASKEIVICNDAESDQALEVSWGFAGQEMTSQRLKLEPASQHIFKVQLPSIHQDNKFIVTLKANNEVISSDTIEYHVLQKEKLELPTLKRNVLIYQTEVQTEELNLSGTAFKSLGKPGAILPTDPEKEILLVMEGSSDRYLDKNWNKLVDFLEKGGRILCLKQDKFPKWSPVKLGYWSALQPAPPTYQAMGWAGTNNDLFFTKYAPVLIQDHPVFNGITTPFLNNWDSFDGRVADDVFLRPSSLDNYFSGAFRVLAAGSRREHITLAEAKVGKGIILFCQANLMANSSNTQVQALLHNMLSYLDSETIWSQTGHIKLSGSFSTKLLQDFLNIEGFDNTKANPLKNDVLIATDGANLEEIQQWAIHGGKVLVLSSEVARQFPGVKIEKNDQFVYGATSGENHDLLAGVSSANFLNYRNNSIQGYFSDYPSDAKILLNGFQKHSADGGFLGLDIERFEDAGPVAINIPTGKGELVLTTMTPWQLNSADQKELFTLLLANAGLSIPVKTDHKETIRTLPTVPIQIDGILNEWTDDMEDNLVSQYIHAQPVYMKAENATAGLVNFDLDFSGIAYTLWNNQSLFLSGIVFKEDRRIEPGEPFADQRNFRIVFYLNSQKVEVVKESGDLSVLVNGRKDNQVLYATGKLNSVNLTDAQNLDFKYIHKTGKIQDLQNVPGETFELAIPWKVFNDEDVIRRKDGKILIQWISEKGQLQNPFDAELNLMESWNEWRFEDGSKVN